MIDNIVVFCFPQMNGEKKDSSNQVHKKRSTKTKKNLEMEFHGKGQSTIPSLVKQMLVYVL